VRPDAVPDITPPGITAGPKVTGPLIRIAPVAAPAAQEPALAARQERLFNPMVTSAGILKVRDREIRLAGIEAPHFQQRCGEGRRRGPAGGWRGRPFAASFAAARWNAPSRPAPRRYPTPPSATWPARAWRNGW
jgi:hypothetical protein